MKRLAKYWLAGVVIALLPFIVPIASDGALATAAKPIGAPRDAHLKTNRDDLAAPIRDYGEARVIVGLNSPAGGAKGGGAAADRAREQDVFAGQNRLLKRLAGRNVRNVKPLRFHHFVAMTIDSDALDALLADPDVTSIAEDRLAYPLLVDTPAITRADDAWIAGYSGVGQTVAVIDTGVDTTHPFFAGKVVAEACFSAPVGGATSYCQGGVSQQIAAGAGANCPDFDLGCWHGTHVAGIAVGDYGVLTATTGGIAPDASLIAIQVFQRDCSSGSCTIAAYYSDVALALEHVYSLRSTYNIASVNLSLGGDAFSAACDNEVPGITATINSLRDANIATIVASGNSGNAGAISFPACISTAISVGSTTKQAAISSFSNSASFLGLLAPGSSITSALPLAYAASGFGTASGTSMATPHVAGAWAVLKSAKPTASVGELLTALQTGGLPIMDIRNGITKPLIQIGYDNTQLWALGLVLGHGNVQPTVAITSPGDGQTFAAPATITLTATASDPDGGIAKVEYFAGPTKIGEASSSPFTVAWSNVPAANYSITAKATDVLGGTGDSAPVNVSVTAPTPTYQISGTVTASGVALGGVNFAAGVGASCSSSNASGQYSCTVPSGWTGTLSPSAIGYDFTPSARSYGNVTSEQSAQDYIAILASTTTLSSSVNLLDAGQAVTFVATVSSSGSPTGTVAFNDGASAIVGCAAITLTMGQAICTTSTLVVGVHSITAMYSGDANNAASNSNAFSITIDAADTNVALASAGALASASGVFGTGYPVAAVNNNERAGTNWGSGGGWADATGNAYPDWVQIDFNGSKSIDRVVVYSVQDTYANPVEPDDSLAFTLYGITAFDVQGWNGSAWVTLATVSGNTLVKRSVTFAAFTTNRIRVNITNALASYSRLTEIEAWDVGAASLPPTTTTLTSTPNPAPVGTDVTFTATVTGSAPAGTVTFNDGVAVLCNAVPLAGGQAQCSTSTLSVGSHSIVASYSGDAANAASVSTPVTQDITGTGVSTNVALASAGALASASGVFGTGYPVAAVNNNERAGTNWGSGGGWADATGNAYPDWVQIDFNGSKSIDRVVVYSVQDTYANPVEPDDSLAFTLYGITAFDVQGWNGSAWVTLATVSGNTLVKRSVTFAAFTTNRIRVNITNALASYSRLTEIEAWDVGAASLPPTTTTLTSTPNPAPVGTDVTFTATVTGSAPAGTVTFNDGVAVLCNAVPLAGGQAQCSTSTLSVGSHSIVASYSGDAANAASVSTPVTQDITGTGVSTNVALASAGALASASGVFGTGYPVAAVNNNERAGTNWGSGGGWADATGNAYPDWVQIDFNGSKSIDRVVVYSVQDTYANPVEPDDSLAFTLYGITAFDVQGWNGSAWVTLATVSGNTLVKRSVTFAAFTTNRIRVNITNALASYSRLTEIEAWDVGAASLPPTTTTLTSTPNPAPVGTDVTFTATVTGSAPAGTVTFNDGVAVLCNAVPLAGGQAQCSTSTLSVGSHSIVASYSGDAANAASVSTPVTQDITGTGVSTNVALASAGALASASGVFGTGYPVAAVNNNERAGTNWGSGGGWADATGNAYPDWVQIDFNGSKSIDRVVVYSVQDTYANPVEPDDSLAFTLYGITAFDVQGWNGSAWVTLATVSGNTLVKRSVTFAAFTTNRIRVNITNALASYSRLTEIEAWDVGAVSLNRPTVTQSASTIQVDWNAVQGATEYAVYASYDSSSANIYATYRSLSSSITIPVDDFPSTMSLYFSVAAIVNGQPTERSKWAYVVSFDDVDLGFLGSITIGDFNNDGCAEVLGTMNDCNGNLIPRPEADLGLSALRAPGRSYRDARIADLNGDGIPDLIANVYSSISDTESTTLLFYGRDDGTFIQATPAQFPAIYRGYGETVVVADFDNDGHLDVFLPNYTHSSPYEQNYLLHNRGDGTFVEVADTAGVANREWPGGLQVEGAQALDIDGDGLLDIYAGSHLYINNGDLTFTDRRQQYGLPVYFDEGVKFFDWNNDGHIDLVLEHPDNGPRLFQFDGLSYTELHNVFATRYYNAAYGLNVEDVDGDGYLDVIVGGGIDSNGTDRSQTLFLRRQNGYTISDLGLGGGAPIYNFLVGLADFDANGTMDVILQHGNLHYLNNSASDSTSIKVFMFDEGGAQNQHGRTIRATPQDDPTFIMTRIVDGGSGYLSNNEYAVTFPAPKGDRYWITAQFDIGIVGGWANAGSIVKIFRDGRFEEYPR